MIEPESPIAKQETIDGGALMCLQGDIEFTQAPRLRNGVMKMIDDHQPQRLILDLSGVGYMDSSGIATIVEVLQRQRRESRKLVLCSLQEKVYSMFKLANLHQLFTIVKDLEAAKQA